MTMTSLHVRTPLIESHALSREAGCHVWLKLENTQPTGCFKIRGVANTIQKEIAQGKKRIVSSSSGNSGLCCAYVGQKLGVPVKVIVPGCTSQYMVDRITEEGAEVIVHGKVLNDANELALEIAQDPEVAFIHPFDHPATWEGHESMIEEIYSDLTTPPDLVVAVAGGGGLLAGIRQGLEKVGWLQVPVLAMETEGANCFRAAIDAGQPVTIPDITSIAKSLGALQICDKAFELYQKGNIFSEVVTDKQCIEACLRFADDHRMLVEPACGATLSAVYSGVIKRLQQEKHLPTELYNIVLIVCGGHCVTMSMLEGWKKQFGVQ